VEKVKRPRALVIEEPWPLCCRWGAGSRLKVGIRKHVPETPRGDRRMLAGSMPRRTRAFQHCAEGAALIFGRGSVEFAKSPAARRHGGANTSTAGTRIGSASRGNP